MTVINNIEIDNIQYNFNNIKRSILNNSIIEDKLHVIIVISNPCLFAKRYILIKEFIKRFEMEENDVILYIVELAYGNQKFIITDKNCKNHLQLRTEIPIWHKENMINLGIKNLLPKNWKAVAWIDADIEFDNVNWAKDALKLLNGSYDIIQLFTHCVDMDIDNNNMNIFTSFGERYNKGYPWHPGYAWACTRNTYDKMGGLYENAILGSGDHIMALSLIGRGIHSINNLSSDDYKNNILEFEKKVKNFRIGNIPGTIRHHFHGSKKNRKYSERWQILIKYNFSPLKDLTKDKNGILIPTDNCSKEMIFEIYNYFKERNEDEFLHEKNLMGIKSNMNAFCVSVDNKENIGNKEDIDNIINIINMKFDKNEYQSKINTQYIEPYNQTISNSIDTPKDKKLTLNIVDNFGIAGNMIYNSKYNNTFTYLDRRTNETPQSPIFKQSSKKIIRKVETNELLNNTYIPVFVKDQQSPISKNLIINKYNNPNNIVNIEKKINTVNTPTKHKICYSPNTIKKSVQNIQKPQAKQMTQPIKQISSYKSPTSYKPPTIIEEKLNESFFTRIYNKIKCNK